MIYIQMISKRKKIHRRVPTARNMHTLFHKQVVGGRKTKMKKGLLDAELGKIARWFHFLLGGSKTHISNSKDRGWVS